MFLAFPLDFEAREIITEAVGLFSSVINWIDNARCRSRLVLRCKVITLVSRVPRSIIISEGNPMGDQGNSWTVPVFVLNSAQNDVMAGDEDPVPGNGNPHPAHPQQNDGNGNGNQVPGFFEAVQDLDEVHQENVNQGWELPPLPRLLSITTGGLSGQSLRLKELMRMSCTWLMTWLMRLSLMLLLMELCSILKYPKIVTL
jgi:hypothetical protein